MKPLRILLVDDEAPTRASLTTWLQRCGFDAVAVDGPASADRVLVNDLFDLILSDVMMPGNARLEWVERRLASESMPPILLMTGNPELETALRAANLPVAGYVIKPFDFADIRRQIERLGDDHRRRVELRALSHEVLRLLALRVSDPLNPDDPFNEQLHQLACELAVEAQRRPREISLSTDRQPWHDAIVETILVIEKTKGSFQSKELGALRQRLLSLVAPDQLLLRRQPLAPEIRPSDPSCN